MSEEGAVIRLQDVHKAFDGQTVLDGVTLGIKPGQTTAIIGPSGCGKSVLLKHVIGLLRPDRGKVFFHDREISAMAELALVSVRQRIGFVFQNAALFDSMSVEENVCFPLNEHGVGTGQQRRGRCGEVLALVGLDGMQARMPGDLSGGERKRVALARAIALGPEVILYDEPTTGLDPIRADLINELMLKLQGALGTTAVLVTHDMNSARKVADRVVMLYEGHLIADSAPEDLDRIEDNIVSRFVRGVASEEELARLRGEPLTNSLPMPPGEQNTEKTS